MTDPRDLPPPRGASWRQPGLALLAGVAPLAAASRSGAGGLALGLAALLVLCTGNVLGALLGALVPPARRPAVFLFVAGLLVAAVDLLFQARWYGLYAEVGAYLPLITCTALVPGLAAASTGRRPGAALADGLVQGAAVTLLLAAVGAVRGGLVPWLPLAALAPAAFFLLALVAALTRVQRRGPRPA